MEVPVINRISDFETGISSFQDPTIISNFLAFSGIEKIHQAYSFWKWGALILAFLASFSTIINKIKTLILQFQTHPLISSPTALVSQEDWDDYDSDSDIASSYSFSDDDDGSDDDEVEEDESSKPSHSPHNAWRAVDEDFSVKGSGHYIDDQWQNGNFRLRRRRNSSIGDLFSWSELTSGKNSVVKLWDNLGLGFGLNLSSNEPNDVVSVYDMNREEKVASMFGKPSSVYTSSKSPAVVVSADTTDAGSLLRVWDTRVGCRIPEILAEWRPVLGRIVGVNVEKVYVRDDVTGGLTVGDMRKVRSPLVNVTEAEAAETWWDADAVMVTDESR